MDPCSPAAFEAKYAAEPDPWRFTTSPYELGRYHSILELLSRDHYQSGYEPACSLGVLTARLAPRCDRLLAVDVAPTAVAVARRRCQDLPNTRVEIGSVAEPRREVFDLIVFSELGYYFSRETLTRVLRGVLSSLAAGGELVACHWTGESEDHVLAGAEVHDEIARQPELDQCGAKECDGFILDSWQRR